MSHSRKLPGVLLLAALFLFVSIPALGAVAGDPADPPAEELLADRDFPPADTEQPGETGVEVRDAGTSMWDAVKALTIVLGLILLAGWLLRRFGRMAGIPVTSDRMRVIAALPLKGANSLYLVEMDGQELLVGVADGQINLLKELTAVDQTPENPPEESQTGIESGTIEVNKDVSKRKDFSESLKTSIQRQEMENQAKRSESLKDKLSGLIDKSKSLGDLD
jgi:flagellar biosynthetic protein FliO